MQHIFVRILIYKKQTVYFIVDARNISRHICTLPTIQYKFTQHCETPFTMSMRSSQYCSLANHPLQIVSPTPKSHYGNFTWVHPLLARTLNAIDFANTLLRKLHELCPAASLRSIGPNPAELFACRGMFCIQIICIRLKQTYWCQAHILVIHGPFSNVSVPLQGRSTTSNHWFHFTCGGMYLCMWECVQVSRAHLSDSTM